MQHRIANIRTAIAGGLTMIRIRVVHMLHIVSRHGLRHDAIVRRGTIVVNLLGVMTHHLCRLCGAEHRRTIAG